MAQALRIKVLAHGCRATRVARPSGAATPIGPLGVSGRTGRLLVDRAGAKPMQPPARSAGNRDETVEHRGAEVCETVTIERRELRGEIVNDEPRPRLRPGLGRMARMNHLIDPEEMRFFFGRNVGRDSLTAILHSIELTSDICLYGRGNRIEAALPCGRFPLGSCFRSCAQVIVKACKERVSGRTVCPAPRSL